MDTETTLLPEARLAALYGSTGVTATLGIPIAERREDWDGQFVVSWQVTFVKGRARFAVKWSSGTGCVDWARASKGLHGICTREIKDLLAKIAKHNGATERFRNESEVFQALQYAVSGSNCLTHTPNPAEVLARVCQDGREAVETPFEDWASEFGYDPDSRKAEATHRTCREQYSHACQMLTAEERDAFADLASEL